MAGDICRNLHEWGKASVSADETKLPILKMQHASSKIRFRTPLDDQFDLLSFSSVALVILGAVLVIFKYYRSRRFCRTRICRRKRFLTVANSKTVPSV